MEVRASILSAGGIPSASSLSGPFYPILKFRAVSSVGRAPRSQRGGRGFESLTVHQKNSPHSGAAFLYLRDSKSGGCPMCSRPGRQLLGGGPEENRDGAPVREPWRALKRSGLCAARLLGAAGSNPLPSTRKNSPHSGAAFLYLRDSKSGGCPMCSRPGRQLLGGGPEENRDGAPSREPWGA